MVDPQMEVNRTCKRAVFGATDYRTLEAQPSLPVSRKASIPDADSSKKPPAIATGGINQLSQNVFNTRCRLQRNEAASNTRATCHASNCTFQIEVAEFHDNAPRPARRTARDERQDQTHKGRRKLKRTRGTPREKSGNTEQRTRQKGGQARRKQEGRGQQKDQGSGVLHNTQATKRCEEECVVEEVVPEEAKLHCTISYVLGELTGLTFDIQDAATRLAVLGARKISPPNLILSPVK